MISTQNIENAAVTGKSILTSSVKILNTDIRNCTYLEFKSFCDFIEAVVIHDNIIILGPFTDRETEALDLVQKLNTENKSPFIYLEDSTEDKLIINNNNVDVVFKEILSKTFRSQSIEFVRHQLFQKSHTNRYTDDEKTEYLDQFVKICTESDDDENCFNSLEEHLANYFKSARESEFIKYLFRAFMIATYAKIVNGTALFTGSRKPIGALIKERNQEFPFVTLPCSIYRYANSIYLNNKRHLFFEEKIKFYYPLLLSIVTGKIKSKETVLHTIFELRTEFKEFRKNIVEQENHLTGAKAIKKHKNLIKDTKSYYNEIGLFLSDSILSNLGKKYSNEIIFDEVEVKFQYEDDTDNTNGEGDETSTSSSLNVIKIAKHAVKFLRDFSKYKKTKQLTKPLGMYLCNYLNEDKIHPLDTIINIKEYYYQNMRVFDKFTRKNNL